MVERPLRGLHGKGQMIPFKDARHEPVAFMQSIGRAVMSWPRITI